MEASRGKSRVLVIIVVVYPDAEENCSTGSSERVNGCYSSFLLSNIHTRLRLVTGSSVPVLKLARETLVQWVGDCSVRVA